MARYVADGEQQKSEDMNAKTLAVEEKETEKAADPYAHMFAEWDLVPPQMVIRRVRRTAQ